MRTNRNRWLKAAALPLCCVLVLGACGDDGEAETDDSAADGSDDGGSEGGSGTITVSGSSTVEPISVLVAEEYAFENEDVQINVDGPGTGDGFELFCNGETDVSDASRPIKDEEAALCAENGVEYVELEIGFDGLAVMTNPANDAVECLTLADLYAMIGPEAEGINNWNDAEALAQELGSTTDLPDAELFVAGPGAESGTFDSFIELAFADIAEARVEEGVLPEDHADARSDYQASSEDVQIVQGIEANDTSLGWVGFGVAEAEADAIRELEVDAGDGCVAPSPESIADGSYPLSRSLYIYVNLASAEENEALVDYIDLYLSDLTTWVEESGYVALPDDRAAATLAAWEER